jgi:hypothetical protein
MKSPRAPSPPKSDEFTYLPLNDDEIRLLLLLPRQKPGVINCELVVSKLHDEPVYEALSYTWSPPESMREIFIRDRAQQVRENL